ncbi:MAG: BolA/IbaG family iron-sulfur metabolism protein [Candidatus Binatia bacterium]
MTPESLRSPADLCEALRGAIRSALPGAGVTVEAGSPGHFEIRVSAESFAGKSMVEQQQMVYGAIAHFMRGEAAPVHAIDRLLTEMPSSGA